MPSENKLIDDFTKLTGDIVYTMLDAKKEMDRNLHENIYQLIANVDQMTQEQFNALKELLNNAKASDNPVQQFMEEMQTQFNAFAGSVASPAPASTETSAAKPKAKKAAVKKKATASKPVAKKKSVSKKASTAGKKATAKAGPKTTPGNAKSQGKQNPSQSTQPKSGGAAKAASSPEPAKSSAGPKAKPAATTAQKQESVRSDTANAAAGVDTKPAASPIVRNSSGNVTSLNPSLLVSSTAEDAKTDSGSQTKQ